MTRAPVPWTDQVQVADWIVDVLTDDLASVAWLVPRSFPAVARLLHPVVEMREGVRIVTPWSEIAGQAGRPLTAETQFPALVDSAGGQWTRHDQQFIGTLPPEEARVLVDVLRRFTTTPSRCWFGLSSEFGWNGHDAPVRGAPFEAEPSALSPDAAGPGMEHDSGAAPSSYEHPLVNAPHRSFMLYSGAIDDALLVVEQLGWSQVPNLWWPKDRAWCVRTDIDLDSTYIAGSDRLVEALMADPRLEVLRATFDDKIARGV